MKNNKTAGVIRQEEPNVLLIKPTFFFFFLLDDRLLSITCSGTSLNLTKALLQPTCCDHTCVFSKCCCHSHGEGGQRAEDSEPPNSHLLT